MLIMLCIAILHKLDLTLLQVTTSKCKLIYLQRRAKLHNALFYQLISLNAAQLFLLTAGVVLFVAFMSGNEPPCSRELAAMRALPLGSLACSHPRDVTAMRVPLAHTCYTLQSFLLSVHATHSSCLARTLSHNTLLPGVEPCMRTFTHSHCQMQHCSLRCF